MYIPGGLTNISLHDNQLHTHQETQLRLAFFYECTYAVSQVYQKINPFREISSLSKSKDSSYRANAGIMSE